MNKPTLMGSALAKLFPALFQVVSENASTEQFNAAETEAARIQAQIDGLGGSTTPPATAEAVTPPTTTPEAVTAPTAEQLTAMTSRATTAEARITELTGQLASLQAERDRYKAWHDKQSAGGTKLPSLDASVRNPAETPELSAASADALAMFQKRKAQA